MAAPDTLLVQLYGRTIATITYLGSERSLFTFNEHYINDLNRPTLSLSFKDHFGQLITDTRPYRSQLMPFFSNLLPEGPLRHYLAQLAGVKPNREFYLLWALGHDLPGALTVVADARHAVSEPLPSDYSTNKALASSAAFLRFSLAGVQLKFSAVRDAHGGLTIPAHGTDGHHIVKLPSAHFNQLPENEYSMMTLAKKVGINVPPFELISTAAISNLPAEFNFSSKKAFAIKRFDRSDDGTHIHMEDFAQVFGVYPQDKYEKASYRSIARVLAVETNNTDIAEFIRRATFNVLIGNGDMHLKNWSLIYPDKQHARLAPAYDLISTLSYLPNDKAALTVSRSKAFSDYTFAELEHLAAKTALPSPLLINTAKETIDRFMQCWAKEKNHLPMASSVRLAIDKHLNTLPIVRELR